MEFNGKPTTVQMDDVVLVYDYLHDGPRRVQVAFLRQAGETHAVTGMFELMVGGGTKIRSWVELIAEVAGGLHARDTGINIPRVVDANRVATNDPGFKKGPHLHSAWLFTSNPR